MSDTVRDIIKKLWMFWSSLGLGCILARIITAHGDASLTLYIIALIVCTAAFGAVIIILNYQILHYRGKSERAPKWMYRILIGLLIVGLMGSLEWWVEPVPKEIKEVHSTFHSTRTSISYSSSHVSGSSHASGSNGSLYTGVYYGDPYDVYDYEDADDFADEWQDDFDSWDDAEDYWNDRH